MPFSPRRALVAGLALLAGVVAAPSPAPASELRGSPNSMRRQHREALQQDYTFLRTPEQLEHFTELGRLEPVVATREVALSKVSFPYARPEVKAFIDRLAGEYRRETGYRLVITSLTRPRSEQPGNAHRLSVHPAGMAVDLRVPSNPAHRAWLESRLLELEELRVIDATRERYPPHYHVAVFGDEFMAYAGSLAPLPPLPPLVKASVVAMAVARADSALRAGARALAQPVESRRGGSDTAAWAFALATLLAGATVLRRYALQVVRQ